MSSRTTLLNLKKLYEIDDHLWLEETIKILKSGHLERLDIENLIEELEALGRRDQAQVKSLLILVIKHLLFLEYWREEYDYNANHWREEIVNFRQQLDFNLTTNLRNMLREELDDLYHKARRQFQEKTQHKIKNLPEKCPYFLEQLLDEEWLPERNPI
jgi:predicted unusual protein kinase regulating ubiquinone biosynthesis (AarF/ABC1/UbiB family)